MYAKGYRFDTKENRIEPTGLLVIKSDPDGAQVFINGELKSATNTTISLPPGEYEIRVEKQGYISWIKKLKIEFQVVTEETAHLFRSAPSLTAITFSGALDPTPSYDMAKISYIVPQTKNSATKEADFNGKGLWMMEMFNLPLGFSREPRRIIDGNLESASWQFSPDDKEILLDLGKNSYLIPSSSQSSLEQLLPISQVRKTTITKSWEKIKKTRTESKLAKLPDEMRTTLKEVASSIVFSPDERMVLYTATKSASLKDKFIKDYPGASTQKQDRDIKPYHTYIYDIKEDRNFLIDEKSDDLVIEGGFTTKAKRRLSFLPTSRNLILAEPNRVIIMDYDGTNRHIVYEGNYVAPFAFPTLSNDRIIILTNFGAEDKLPNLYSVGVK